MRPLTHDEKALAAKVLTAKRRYAQCLETTEREVLNLRLRRAKGVEKTYAGKIEDLRRQCKHRVEESIYVPLVVRVPPVPGYMKYICIVCGRERRL